MRTSTACIYFVAGTVLQVLLWVHDAALAQRVAAFSAVHLVRALARADARWLSRGLEWATEQPRWVSRLWFVLCWFVQLYLGFLAGASIAGLWTKCFWSAAIVSALPLATLRPRQESDEDKDTSVRVEFAKRIKVMDAFVWTAGFAHSASRHLRRLFFPATVLALAVQKFVDALITQTGQHDREAIFAAAQTGNHLELDRLVLNVRGAWWRRALSPAAARSAGNRLYCALRVAAANGHPECVRVLLAAGAPADQLCGRGMLTPARQAVKGDDAHSLRLLLAAKARLGGTGHD